MNKAHTLKRSAASRAEVKITHDKQVAQVEVRGPLARRINEVARHEGIPADKLVPRILADEFMILQGVVSFGPSFEGDLISIDEQGGLWIQKSAGERQSISPANACRRIALGMDAHNTNGDDLTFLPCGFVRLCHLLASDLEAPAWRDAR